MQFGATYCYAFVSNICLPYVPCTSPNPLGMLRFKVQLSDLSLVGPQTWFGFCLCQLPSPFGSDTPCCILLCLRLNIISVHWLQFKVFRAHLLGVRACGRARTRGCVCVCAAKAKASRYEVLPEGLLPNGARLVPLILNATIPFLDHHAMVLFEKLVAKAGSRQDPGTPAYWHPSNHHWRLSCAARFTVVAMRAGYRMHAACGPVCPR